MKINCLSYEPAGGWILYDYAEKLANSLRKYVDEVDITSSQLPGYDITFHINYQGLRQILVPGLHCTFVTHIDSFEKFSLVRAQAAAGVWGFCMSEETSRKLTSLTGIANFSSFPPPAMIDAPARSTSVFIAARTYPDGRKNEQWAIDFIRQFPPAMIKVNIMGSGWGDHVSSLCSAGFVVDYREQFEKSGYRELLRVSDYLLVTGFDEGALSVLDAILYDVVPIVTAQGYHLEQPMAAKMFLYATYEQLMDTAQKIIGSFIEQNAMSSKLTDWDGFALKHYELWKKLQNAA